MGRPGSQIPENKRKEIALHYSVTNNQQQTATHFGISVTTIRKIIKENKKLLDTINNKKKKTVESFIKAMSEDAEKALDVANLYFDELAKPSKVRTTSPRDAAVVYGVIVDKQVKIEEIRLKKMEIDLKRKEIAAMEKGVTINIAPSLGSFSNDPPKGDK